MKEDYWFSGAAFVSGIGVWALVSALSGRQEAWDSEWYLRLGVPVLCLVTGVLGFIEPQHVWRWGILPAAGQAAGMYVSQEIGNLWPLGLIASWPCPRSSLRNLAPSLPFAFHSALSLASLPTPESSQF